ncbi:MAG: universal stress protein [Caldilineaceae bacterium]|jgi:nucleotide-binding universal stress UspA family protein|nr:universal stress protein [Caldilineaceae bacterium]
MRDNFIVGAHCLQKNLTVRYTMRANISRGRRMYKTILVPLDGSPRAETILSHAASLAAKYQAKLVLLQVVEPIVAMVTPYDMVPYVDKDAAERSMEEAKSYLAGKEGELRGQGIEAKSVVESGPVVSVILNVAEREKADLVAMASHGRTGLSRVFYGSVAAGILHKADRPLLLIRAQD